MISISFETIIIIMLITFIVGLLTGVSMTRPRIY